MPEGDVPAMMLTATNRTTARQAQREKRGGRGAMRGLHGAGLIASIRLLEFDDDRVGVEEERDHGDEEHRVAQIDDAAHDRVEMGEEAERGDRVDQRLRAAQPARKPSTIGEPLTVKRKQAAAVSTKAITWFLVKADSAAPMARNAPAMRKLPI